MKIFALILFTFKLIFAFPFELESIRSNFKQTITDDHNKTLTYTGNLRAKKPALAHWHYATPIEKEIYIDNANVTIVEPDLEQAIIRDIGDTIDIIAILKASQKIDDTHYRAHYNDKSYDIFLKDNTLGAIRYVDDFGNKSAIEFSDLKLNLPVQSSQLKAVIPEDYDIIR